MACVFTRRAYRCDERQVLPGGGDDARSRDDAAKRDHGASYDPAAHTEPIAATKAEAEAMREDTAKYPHVCVACV